MLKQAAVKLPVRIHAHNQKQKQPCALAVQDWEKITDGPALRMLNHCRISYDYVLAGLYL